MKSDRLLRFYDRLTATERFRLMIESLAREDDLEAERLTATCPKKVNRSNDPAFAERLRASRSITDTVVLSVLPALAKAEIFGVLADLLGRTLESASDQVALAYEIGRLDGETGQKDEPCGESSEVALQQLRKPTDAAHERVTDELVAARRRLIKDARSTLDAFTLCCRDDMGLEGQVVLQAHFAPFVERLSSAELEEADPDPEVVDERLRTLRQSWEALV